MAAAAAASMARRPAAAPAGRPGGLPAACGNGLPDPRGRLGPGPGVVIHQRHPWPGRRHHRGYPLEVRQAAQFFGPGIAVVVVGQSAGQPAQAALLHHHQRVGGRRRLHWPPPARPAVEPPRPGPTTRRRPGEPGPGPTARPAGTLGVRCWSTATTNAGRRQADAFGLSRAGEAAEESASRTTAWWSCRWSRSRSAWRRSLSSGRRRSRGGSRIIDGRSTLGASR